MAPRERKSGNAPVSFNNDIEEGAEDTSRAGRTPSSSARVRKASKPSVEIIDIDADEEAEKAQPRLGGVLRGLNPNNVLPQTQISVESTHERNTPTRVSQENKHATRQSRHGRSEANYDTKYHPMDEVTRPKRAAKRRSVSIMANDDDVETDEESLPLSAQGSDSEQGNLDNESAAEEDLLTERKPDPRASRHSSRAAAQRLIDYNTKRHPQDYGVPGYRRNARLPSQSQDRRASEVSQIVKEGKSPNVPIEIASEDAKDERTRPTARPRKKLRTLEDDRATSSGSRKKRKQTKQKQQAKTKDGKVPLLASMSSQGVDAMVEMAMTGSQLPQTNPTNDETEVRNTPNSAEANLPQFNESSDANIRPRHDLANKGDPSLSDDSLGRASDGLASAGNPLSSPKRTSPERDHDEDFAVMDEEPDPNIENGGYHAVGQPSYQPLGDVPASFGDVTAEHERATHSTAGGPWPLSQYITYSSSSEEAIIAETHAAETRQNVIQSIHKLRDSSSRNQSPQPTSHRLAVSSRKHTSSATVTGNIQDDLHLHEHGQPSEFEEQLAITDMPANESNDGNQVQINSEGSDANLPVSAGSRSDEQYPSSVPSLGAKQVGGHSDDSLPPTDAPGFNLEEVTTVKPAEHEMDVAYVTPITSNGGDVLQQGPSKRRRRPHRHSAPLGMRSYITPQSMERRRSGEAYIQNRLASEFRIPFGPSRWPQTGAGSPNDSLRLETVKWNEHPRSDLLISSDPTSVGKEATIVH